MVSVWWYRWLIFYRLRIRCRGRCWKAGNACGCVADIYLRAYPQHDDKL
jgi:hypothetical protein